MSKHPSEPAPPAPPPASAGQVLIVEPDLDIARMLELRLARDGHRVLHAETGRAALAMARRQAIDVALVDLGLADVGGLALLAELRRAPEPLEVLVMSIDPSADVSVEALEAGAFDVVVKPFSNLRLVTAKVASAVEKVQGERERRALLRLLEAQGSAKHAAAPAEAASQEPDTATLDLDRLPGADPLTGLPNQAAAEARFRQEAARALRYDRPLCIALATVEGLEAVADRLGGAAADAMLRGAAAMLASLIRDVDFAARLRTGEFFLLFPETPKANGAVVLERIRQRLAGASFTDLDAGHAPFSLGACIGWAGLPADTMNADALWEAAEAALARARLKGDALVAFEPALARRR